jgi:hypothetical protein
MNKFAYEAIDRVGNRQRGAIDGDSQRDAAMTLRAMGWYVVSMHALTIHADLTRGAPNQSEDEFMDAELTGTDMAGLRIPPPGQCEPPTQRSISVVKALMAQRPRRATRDGDRMLQYWAVVLHRGGNFCSALYDYAKITHGRSISAVARRVADDASSGSPFTDLVDKYEWLFGSVATEYLTFGTTHHAAHRCIAQYFRLRAELDEMRRWRRWLFDRTTRRFAIALANAMELTGDVPWAIRVASLEVGPLLRYRLMQRNRMIPRGLIGAQCLPQRPILGLGPGFAPGFLAAFDAGWSNSDLPGVMRTVARM